MRDVDERVAAVQGRVRRMKRKHDRAAVGALAFMSVLAFIGLMGMPIANGQTTAASEGSTLFGASSLFGPSIGGYVLVALVAAMVAVLITVFCLMRRKSSDADGEEAAAPDLPDESKDGLAADGDAGRP